MTQRVRALAMLGLSASCAGLAASLVQGYANNVREQIGPLVPVLVVSKQVPRGKLLTRANAEAYVSATRVPARYASPHSFRSAREIEGLRALTSIPEGSYVDEGQLAIPTKRAGRALRPESAGERLVEVSVAGARTLGETLHPGARVDVLITSERGAGQSRTYVALQRVELVDFRAVSAPAGDTSDHGEGRVAALRVTLRQAVLLTAAQNFAREIRLVARPPGDDQLVVETAVTAGQLGP